MIDEGEAFIPATQRPDGTWRKARRVKQGYVPQEEVPVYENRGVQWLKSKPTLPPGLNPADAEASKKKTPDPTVPMSKNAKKNAKRKERKKQQATNEKNVNDITQSLEETKIRSDQSDKSRLNQDQSGDSKPNPSQSDSEGGEKEKIVKRIRNLRKKIKQIEDLETKIQSGELKTPDKDQVEKVSKKNAVLSEIEDLEAALDNL